MFMANGRKKVRFLERKRLKLRATAADFKNALETTDRVWLQLADGFGWSGGKEEAHRFVHARHGAFDVPKNATVVLRAQAVDGGA